jgi:hypothetical protein
MVSINEVPVTDQPLSARSEVIAGAADVFGRRRWSMLHPLLAVCGFTGVRRLAR